MPRRFLACCCLTLALGLPPLPAAEGADDPVDPDQARTALFLVAFKHPPPNISIDGFVIVVLDGNERQRLRAVLSGNGQNICVAGRPLLDFLAPTLQPEMVRQLEPAIDREGWLSRAALQKTGLAVSFDARRFELAIATPPGMRQTTVQYLNNPPSDRYSADALSPAPISGFLNMNLKGTTRTDSLAGASRQNDAGFAADGALTVRGVTLEGSAFGQTGAGRGVYRGDVRLVYDRPQRALRFIAGDLVYPVLGYQTTVAMGGIGISRDFSLQPLVHTYRTGEFDFYLERPAEVKVWLNESLVSTLQLPAGAHDIRGLIPAVGQNDIRLEVEDSAGRRELLAFSFIHNPVLLDKGRRIFSYNAGLRRALVNGEYRYDAKEPVISASYLQGLTDETTLGGYAQADTHRSLLGVKAMHIVSFGTLQLDTAASAAEGESWDAATRLSLTRVPPGNSRFGVQSYLSAEYLGRNFGALDTFAPAGGDAWNFLASLAVPLGRGLTGQFSTNYTSMRSPVMRHVYGASATLTQRWGRHVSGSVSLRHRRPDHQPSQTDLLFGITVNFSRGAGTFSASKELESDTVSARWDSGRPTNASAPYAFASARVDPDAREYKAGAGYWGNVGLAEIAQTRSEFERSGSDLTRDETAVRLQTAFVFADTTVALARPIAENFAIVTGQDGLRGIDLKVDPDGVGGSRARSSWLGPAVLGDIVSYRLRDVRIEPVNPPLGATPPKTTFQLAAAYKSGFLLKLGQQVQLVAFGRLVDAEAKPLAHQSLEIRRLDAPGEKPLATFTGRNGAFQASGLRAGRYEIVFPGAPRHGRVVIEIKTSPDGLCRLGDVILAGQ